MDRRGFLKLTGAALASGTIAACGGTSGDGKAASSSGAGAGVAAGGNRKVRLGFIALTDCASLVMAKELGYFAERGLDVSVEKQANWASTRDNLLTGEIDGAHCLFGMPFSVASGVGGNGSRGLKIAMMLNNNGQAITLNKEFASVGYGDLEKARAALLSKSPTLAMTFPGGTHDMWIRYWLKACRVDASAVKLIVIPPAQMVANMKVGAMDGYCVGEPWGAVAADQDIGFTHITTQDIWQHHPEKALVVNERFATERKDVLKDVMGAVMKAAAWLDDLNNRKKASEVIGTASYVSAPPAEIEGRLKGAYKLGAGLPDKTYTDDYMTFFRSGNVSLPQRGHGIWFLSQYRRLGLLKEDPPYRELADSLILSDLYREVAEKEKVPVPIRDDLAPFTIKLDGAVFDPARPQEEAARL